MSTPDLSTQIEQAASTPASASGQGHSVTARPVGDLIDAALFSAAVQAVKKPHRGIYRTKLLPVGPVSDEGRGPPDGFDRRGVL